MIEINGTVPSFTTKNENGELVSSQSLQGSKYIVLFYGQDDTPTCTKQVCAASDVYADAKAKGYQMFGVSGDTVGKHAKFKAKYNLNISLLSDPDKAMMKSFEAFGPKMFMGKEVNGVYRKAYFINESGKIVGKIDDVKAAEQGSQILEVLATL